MALPSRKFKPRKAIKKRTKPRRVKAIKCRPHLDWVVEEFDCAIKSRVCKVTRLMHFCAGPIDPDHIRTRGAGGGDEQVWPLCRCAHDLRGTIGIDEIQRRYSVDAKEMAAHLWSISPPGRVYRYKVSRES